MGANRKRRVKALEPHSEIDATNGCNGVEKSGKRSVRQQFQRATGKIEKDEHSSPSGRGEALTSRLETKITSCVEESTELPVLDINTGEKLHPSAKIKLQLFPIDESTRLGLEKDGFHPYLELTLSARKKISSVLKHLDSKWGSSSIAVGEPMLFPYNIAENLASYRWTKNDICISARDVHLTIGSPTVFRLRYGWMSDPEMKTLGQPPALAPFNASSKFEDVQKDCNSNMQKTYGIGEKTELRGDESEKPVIKSDEIDAVVAEKMPSNGAVDSMDTEVKIDSGIGQSLALWADSLTNISIGGLLSEASLQGRFSNFDPKSNGSNAGLQSSQLISDSFDAFLSGQINPPQNPRPPAQASHSSILDAEDTCHAFSFQKFSSLHKDSIASSGSAYSHASSQETSSKSFKHPNAIEANIQPQGQACQQSDTDLLLCSRVYSDESTLGLSGIKWTDSLGPFDLGVNSSHKIISGDNISIPSSAK
ncbi:N-terminal nucleophile aminohydrolases (Ntn hydrolases) superfamily protein isoform 1 [Theobroma cacao]|uniref:N-terminal nucleophile aminohydrolases (Ntn hydrolases) superfamily protein isoform 1 n=1 Tax=Theobroma cacao TaxID=3641 RepID=A0A061DQV4_THECC|nr:N-terminal nucleophile aminohydrolases superfamily protein isoform 1 [Theobroma cacao]EOX92333.1 N-terminal nucleophile aminohydrolases (Ntn hydrolases) superfamily protein isoform 1 [Theobroma cacao]